MSVVVPTLKPSPQNKLSMRLNEVSRKKLPKALPVFHHLVSRCINVCRDPETWELLPYDGLSEPKDLPILVAAIREKCSTLVTFNTRHYLPGHPDVEVLRPGDLILRIRD